MLGVLRGPRVLGICLLWASNLALGGCTGEGSSPHMPLAPEVGAPSQPGPSSTGDAGRTTLLASDASALTPDASATTQDAGRYGAPITRDAGEQNQPGPSLPNDAGRPSVPRARDGGAPGLTIASGDAVFFVGNSFFDSFDRRLAEWVPAIGQAVTPPITIKTGSYIVPGNQKLSWFLQQSESQAALASKAYKVFVIQPEEREAVDRTDSFKQAVRDWNDAIVASGAKTMLFMTWDLPNEKGSTFFERLSTAYEEIGDELGIPVIPVGLIYDDCNNDPFPGQAAGSYWLTGGALHQVESGSAVNAYATFGMLTGVNPMGCPIDAPANTNSPELLKYLSDMSWARVGPLVTGE